jgi:hypothetical protein
MRRLLALVVTTVLVAGCGGDQERPQAEMTLEKRIAQIDADPYALTCGDQAKSARVGKRAHFGLADDAHVTDITRLRVAQSIFYAVTEICKGKPASYHPGKEAVEGVRSRKYRVRPRP